jgi:hypothetical protein
MNHAHLGRFYSLTTRKPANSPRLALGYELERAKGAQTLPGMRIPSPTH